VLTAAVVAVSVPLMRTDSPCTLSTTVTVEPVSAALPVPVASLPPPQALIRATAMATALHFIPIEARTFIINSS
jgi:hypothetical protein